MKKIKVAHVLHSVGGVDVHLRIILDALNPDHINNIIIHGKNDTNLGFIDRNGDKVMDFRIPLQRAINPIKDFYAVVKTIRILKRERPDLIHAHSAKGGIIARIASLWYPVTVLYTPHAFSYLSASNNLLRGIYLGLERFFKRFNCVIVACSESERRRAIDDVGFKNNKAICFSNSIKPILISDMLDPEISLPENYICTVGRPSYQKNIEMLIEVIKTLKEGTFQETNDINPEDIHLVVLGVGEYSPNKERVEQLIAKYELESYVTMVPWIDRKQIFSIINKAKLYVSASRYEGLPYSVIEALALSKACVVTDCDGNRDLVKDGVNGFVVKENSVDTMANRIFALLGDTDMRRSFEINALASYNTNFNIENTIGELENIYKAFSK